MNFEQVNSRPARWYTVLGLVLVPLLVAGGFLWAGVNSDNRLHTVQAAIVNLDEAVTLDGQYTPLGRQLSANLVDSDRTENLTWVLDSEQNAREGLDNGSYAAMVIIPKNFSKAATSFATEDAADAEQADIEVVTSPVAGVADATLGKVVANEAATMLNSTLTESYLDQIYIGFNEMGDQYITMADGADQLATGASALADGVGQAADGSKQLATGNRQLADGLGQMATKTATMPKSIRKLANGVGDYVDGVNTMVDESVKGQQTIISTVSQLEDGADSMASQFGAFGSNNELITAATQAAESAVGQVPCPDFGNADLQAALCQAFQAGLKGGAGAGAQVGVTVAGKAAQSGAEQFGSGLTTFRKGLQAAANDKSTAKQLAQLKAGGKKLAKGTDQLADQMPALVKGIKQSASGADQLATGVKQLDLGLQQAASGGDQLADGIKKMADGVAEGKDKLPSYTKSDRKALSTAVAAPVNTNSLSGLADPNLGWISLVLVLALWLGALATYSVVKAVGRGLLSSSESTLKLIGRSLLPGLAVVGVQALLLAGLAQYGLDLTGGEWGAITGLLVLAGITFVVINHALVAWLGGFGRLLSVFFAVITTASALIGAAPSIFGELRPFSPLTPALDAIRSVVTESDGTAIAALTLVGWLIIAGTASAVAVAKRRTTSLAAVLAAG